MKPIMIVPSGLLSAGELKELKTEGYLTIVTDEPEKIKFKGPEEKYKGITNETLLEKALYVISNSGDSSGYTIREWFSRILMNELLSVKQKP